MILMYPMTRMARLKVRGFLVITALLLPLLSGCTNFPPRIYKINIQQGNLVTEQMISKLKRGMSRQQVQETLGTPTLTHALDPNRWDYYYYFKEGTTGKEKERPFAVFFKNERLDHWAAEK